MAGMASKVFNDRVKGLLSRLISGTGKATSKFKSSIRETSRAMDEKIKSMPFDKVIKETMKPYPIKYKSLSRMFNVGKASAGAVWGSTKFITAAPRMAVGMAVKTAIRHPIIAGASLGAISGIGKHVATTAEEKLMHSKSPGMRPNHLGTDGLTLSLSRTRHR